MLLYYVLFYFDHNLPDEEVALVSCKKGEKIVWEDMIRAFVTCIAGNTNFCGVGCADGSLYIYTPAGRRVRIFVLNLSAFHLFVYSFIHSFIFICGSFPLPCGPVILLLHH